MNILETMSHPMVVSALLAMIVTVATQVVDQVRDHRSSYRDVALMLASASKGQLRFEWQPPYCVPDELSPGRMFEDQGVNNSEEKNNEHR